ncbi:MAG TPA: carbon-nitrogen hydrolase family protein [Gemmatimonadaceae bacterium]|nr:carbon-nitrogen hydrolase family protein [Gemmatimonadaceae bacterium]
MEKVTVAVVQAESGPTLERGLERTEESLEAAAQLGAQLVVFPETWLPGYPAWLDVCRDVALWDHEPVKAVYERYASQAVEVAGKAGDELRRMARDREVTVVVGVSERVGAGPGRGTLYNTCLTIGADGTLLNHHRKLVPTYTERLVWGYGDAVGLRASDTPAGRVGALICWEHWMPLARQALHDSGEDIHVALWPTAHERHQLASRHYAFEGRCFVLAAGSLQRTALLPGELEPDPRKITVGTEWVLRGGSAIIGPDGEYVVEPVFDEPRLLVADLPLGRVRRESMTLDVTGHYSRPDCFEFTVTRRRPS